MNQKKEFFEWCQQMGCPPNAYSENVIQMFSKGLIGVVWEDISKRIIPIKEAENIKKNILLHKLKNNIPDNNVNLVNELSSIKVESTALDKQIINLEAEHEQRDFLIREKVQNLRNIRHTQSREKLKKHLIKIKREQTATELRDLMDMRSVCQHLKPVNASKEVDPKTFNDLLNVVGSLSSGGNMEEIYNKVEEIVGNINIAALYSHLYQNIKDNVDRLSKQDAKKNLDQRTSQEVIDIAIAKLCGKHVAMIAKSNLYKKSGARWQENILEHISNIEGSSPTDLSDWLELTLEVEKLKSEKKGLQIEIGKIHETIDTNSYVFAELDRLTSDIRDADIEGNQLISSVRESLILLKSAPTLITKMKAKMLMELQKIANLRLATDYDNQLSIVMNDDLTTELDIFHESLDLAALRTITLKGTPKFTKCCFKEASIAISQSQGSHLISQFPMIQHPIYSLIECSKNLRIMLANRNTEQFEQTRCLSEELLVYPVLKPEEKEFAVKDLALLAKAVCDKIHNECQRCERVQNDWIKQSVQKVMEINDSTVGNSTFQEWVKGYTLLYSMLHINS